MCYYITKTIEGTVDDVIARARDLLGQHGYGILSDIDVKQAFKMKLNKDIRDTRILGVNNPHIAESFLDIDDKVGVLFPFSVLVRDLNAHSVEISFVDPQELMTPIVDHLNASSLINKVKSTFETILNDI